MKAFYDPAQAAHDPKFFLIRGEPRANVEQPERAQRLLQGLAGLGIRPASPGDFGRAPLAAIHTPEYLTFLETGWQRWRELEGASAEIIPNTHPVRYPGTYPTGILGQAGWHQADTACPIGEHTWRSACASANTAIAAAEAILDGEPHAYALCRPPGHHAYADLAGGFCYLNNVAIAAQRLRSRHERIAILDVDVHHGNGTQGIFWHRRDVLTISTHCDPQTLYPFSYGHVGERGAGEGEGFNVNIPLPRGSGDDALLQALPRAAALIEAFAPGVLVVALGLDTSEEDPLQGMKVTTPGFERLGRFIGRLGLPTLYVQEGGYLSPSLGANLASFLTGVMDR
ncbi:MAG: histone deacetylase family protein [Burkholderiaceae bacterium]